MVSGPERILADVTRKPQMGCPVEFSSWRFIPKKDVAKLSGMKTKARIVTNENQLVAALHIIVKDWTTYAS
jgi:hypothetical protein